MERVQELIEPTLAAMGYRLVRVRFSVGSKSVLQVMAERTDDGQMDVDDCATISRALSPLLDVEDVIPGAYVLEVSSPGIDRPLVGRADFERFAGFEVKIELGQPRDGRRRFRGRLLGVEDDAVRLDLAGDLEENLALPLADIAEAKLVMTDELIQASLKKSKQVSGVR